MTDENNNPTVKSVGNGNLRPFKTGYDPRRWLGGRGKKSPEQKQGEEILRAVIWEELSRDFSQPELKPLETSPTIDAMRLMVRQWIKKHPEQIADRIAGKVQERVDVTTNGESLKPLVSIYIPKNERDGNTGA
jgi:hypothetical protein